MLGLQKSLRWSLGTALPELFIAILCLPTHIHPLQLLHFQLPSALAPFCKGSAWLREAAALRHGTMTSSRCCPPSWGVISPNLKQDTLVSPCSRERVAENDLSRFRADARRSAVSHLGCACFIQREGNVTAHPSEGFAARELSLTQVLPQATQLPDLCL